jgi:hypothetical protein
MKKASISLTQKHEGRHAKAADEDYEKLRVSYLTPFSGGELCEGLEMFATASPQPTRFQSIKTSPLPHMKFTCN